MTNITWQDRLRVLSVLGALLYADLRFACLDRRGARKMNDAELETHLEAEQPLEREPVCSECGCEFAWNEDADRRDDGPLFCNPCAQDGARLLAETHV